MSASPFILRGIRDGIPLGANNQVEDYLYVGGLDTYCGLTMALTAEKLGEQYQLTKQEVDEFALRSQQLWKKGMRVFQVGHDEFAVLCNSFELSYKKYVLHRCLNCIDTCSFCTSLSARQNNPIPSNLGFTSCLSIVYNQ